MQKEEGSKRELCPRLLWSKGVLPRNKSLIGWRPLGRGDNPATIGKSLAFLLLPSAFLNIHPIASGQSCKVRLGALPTDGFTLLHQNFIHFPSILKTALCK